MYEYKVDFSILSESSREIEGIATAPVMDHEKEIILKEAIEKALPDYLKLPVLHYNHTERPVGMVKEAKVLENGGLYVKAFIKDTKDADDVWNRISKGEINSFSIYGRRINASDECKIHPNKRTSPCITKSIFLDSITLCGENKINPATHFNIIKSILEDNNNNEEIVLTDNVSKGCGTDVDKSESESSSGETLVNNVADDEISNLRRDIDEIKSVIKDLKARSDVLEKEEMTSNEEIVEENIENKEEEISIPAMKKSEEPETPKEEVIKSELVEEVDTFTKAEVFDEITKAKEKITKAFEHQIEEIKSEIEAVKNETIQKGGNVVVINDTEESKESVSGNYSAISKLYGRK